MQKYNQKILSFTLSGHLWVTLLRHEARVMTYGRVSLTWGHSGLSNDPSYLQTSFSTVPDKSDHYRPFQNRTPEFSIRIEIEAIVTKLGWCYLPKQSDAKALNHSDARSSCWLWATITSESEALTLSIISLNVIRWISTHRPTPNPSSILSTSCNGLFNWFLRSSSYVQWRPYLRSVLM